MAKTARWSPYWLNKAKFHLALHLREHIRRYGPALLFATEAFESYNALIRAKSLHSNRLAPSRDIAYAFAQANRLHQLTCGGFFHEFGTHVPRSSWIPPVIIADEARVWHQAGPAISRLLDHKFSTGIIKYLGHTAGFQHSAPGLS